MWSMCDFPFVSRPCDYYTFLNNNVSIDWIHRMQTTLHRAFFSIYASISQKSSHNKIFQVPIRMNSNHTRRANCFRIYYSFSNTQKCTQSKSTYKMALTIVQLIDNMKKSVPVLQN